MPLLAKRIHDPLLVNGRPAGGTNGQIELLVTLQAIELVLGLSSTRIQLKATRTAAEVVGMVDLAFISQHVHVLDGPAAFVASEIARVLQLLFGIAFAAIGPLSVLDEPGIDEQKTARETSEALRMPVGVDGLDDPPVDVAIFKRGRQWTS